MTEPYLLMDNPGEVGIEQHFGKVYVNDLVYKVTFLLCNFSLSPGVYYTANGIQKKQTN